MFTFFLNWKKITKLIIFDTYLTLDVIEFPWFKNNSFIKCFLWMHISEPVCLHKFKHIIECFSSVIRPWGVCEVLQDVEHLCDDLITHWPVGPVQAHCRMFSRWPAMPFNTCLLTEVNDRRRQGSGRVVSHMCWFLGNRGDVWVVQAGRAFTQQQWF